MLKKLLLSCCALLLAANTVSAEEKIDPATYICAELVAATTSGEPPLFEGLQLDGYAAARAGAAVADPALLSPLLLEVYDTCQAAPADKVLPHWEEARKQKVAATDGPWRADKTSCKDYAANEEDGSGFVIWLDGYQRGKSGQPASALESNESLDAFLDACKKQPGALMLDVLAESVRK
ncbi:MULTISPECIES: hypothetical protein [unclassified Desulfovibrio]|uniref:hypothetical protein n=1 Tax=unclassified Desulfovibrio TaxID=2593640 RepID=UPI001F14FB7E|nr:MULTISPECIES: hypothetical protein [unclassified Desulfovibrio]